MRLNQICSKLLADALNTGEPQGRVLERDCIVRASWFDVPAAPKRRLYVYRKFGAPASEQEAKIVARASGVQWFTLERYPLENPRGWLVTERPELEQEAHQSAAKVRAQFVSRWARRPAIERLLERYAARFYTKTPEGWVGQEPREVIAADLAKWRGYLESADETWVRALDEHDDISALWCCIPGTKARRKVALE